MTVAKGFADRLAQERRLKAAREERDIPNSEIAQAAGTSDANVSKWLSGVTMPRDDMLAALAAYFHVTPGWLRYGEGSRTPGTEGMAPTDTGAPRIEPRKPQRPYVPAKKQGGRGGR